MLPLRSVGRSNGVMVCVDKKFNNVDSKATSFENYIIYIYIYMYAVFVLVPRVDSDK